jgi:hypothetical protein
MAAYMQTKSPDQQMGFVTSRGDDLKGAALGALCAGHDGAEALMGGLRERRAAEGRSSTTPTSRPRSGSRTTRTATARWRSAARPTPRTATSAEGGFGSVDIYKAADGEEIAVKTPKGATAQERAEKFDEAAREVDAHRSAVAGNPANVVGLKGVVRTPEGGIQIALEFASRGDA